jgi:hypothetical protein
MIGPAAGSWFKLDFGKKLERETPINNDKLREEQRKFIGEYTLWVRMTGWRLYLDKKCLCHCNDSNANGGPMDMGLRQLEEKKLLHFEFGKSPAELRLDFSEGYRLVLSDWEGVKPEDDAYTLFGNGQAVTVRMNGDISLQQTKRSRN